MNWDVLDEVRAHLRDSAKAEREHEASVRDVVTALYLLNRLDLNAAILSEGLRELMMDTTMTSASIEQLLRRVGSVLNEIGHALPVEGV